MDWLDQFVYFVLSRTEAWRSGHAVRLDWQDGSHELAGFYRSESSAVRSRRRTERYWRTAPWRPVRVTVVVVSRRDQQLHGRRPRCMSPDCPGVRALVSAGAVR